MAELVRYVRRCRSDGRWARPDVQEAIRTRLAFVLADGYAEYERRVSNKVRDEVFQRANGRCEQCGRVLDFNGIGGDPDSVATIQHVRSNSNDPADLKAFCRRCNLDDAHSRFVPVQPGSKQEAVLTQFRLRSSSPTPLRVCDDEKRWPTIWKDLKRQALEAIAEAECGSDEDLPGFLGWTDQGTPIQDC